jgi:hypothetical protein
MLKLLREQQGEGEITEQQNGKENGDHGQQWKMHGLPQLLAGFDVEEGHDEECGGEREHDGVLHNLPPGLN